MNDCDVAIVGYGPTGMTLAALLGQCGHAVVVLERYKGLYNLPRAACFDDEIMRTFQKLGLVDDLARGVRAQDAYDWVNAEGETLVRLEYDASAPGGWAALYMMYQPHIETVLDRHDRALATVAIRQGVTVSGLEQDGDGVTLTGVDPDGRKQTVRARYVVGADGGGGTVRRALGATMDDFGFQENWLVTDFRMKRPVKDLPMFRQICDPAQPISIVRIGPDHHRFSFMLNPGETPGSATETAGVWARVGAYLTPDDADLIRAVNYVFRSRIADKWRQGRVFLAGDAAHEMPPFLGQGMCSGIRDSHNLAWKLDLVLTGRATDALLDTYQAEREPHVRFITEKAIELGRIQTLRDPVEARRRDERFLARRLRASGSRQGVPARTDGRLPRRRRQFLSAGPGASRRSDRPLRRPRRSRLVHRRLGPARARSLDPGAPRRLGRPWRSYRDRRRSRIGLERRGRRRSLRGMVPVPRLRGGDRTPGLVCLWDGQPWREAALAHRSARAGPEGRSRIGLITTFPPSLCTVVLPMGPHPEEQASACVSKGGGDKCRVDQAVSGIAGCLHVGGIAVKQGDRE